MRTHVPVKQQHLLVLLFLLITFCVRAQVPVYGCKDPAALNFSAAAEIDNGSCKYQRKQYTPTPKPDPLSAGLEETSGLQWAGNALWTFGDSGNPNVLFRVDTGTGAILQSVILEGTTNVDWEDIAFDGTFFYIGDFGNNVNGARDNLKIYKLPLSAIPAGGGNTPVTVPASSIEIISFYYRDQPRPLTPESKSNNTKFDCEAMVVDGGKIHLFTKNWIEKNTTHYVIDGLAAGDYEAVPLETLATNYLVTAADKVPGSNAIVLLGYQDSAPAYHFLTILSAYSNGFYFNGATRQIDLPSAMEMGQAEGLTFRTATEGFISNESLYIDLLAFTAHQRLYTFDMAAFAGDLVLPLSLLQFDQKPADGEQQISWLFSEPAVQVSLQHSRNGTDFTNLQTYRNSRSGSFRHQPSPGANYYRLSWKEKNGGIKYSKVLQVTAEAKTGLSNLVLSASGQLQVVNNGSGMAGCQAKLFSVDGRTVAQAARFTLAPGPDTVRFDKPLNRHTILLLQMRNDKEEFARLVRVE